MFGFNFQSKMLQSESLVAQLAQVQFDSILEKYYSDAGEAGAFGTDALSITAILLNKSKVFASYQKKANMPQPLNYLNLWAAEGLSNLMYAKSDPATGLPALWTQTPKTTKELISLFQPFFGAIDLVQHAKTMQYALNVYGKPFTIPQDLVDAITASAKSKKAVGQKSLAVLALTSVMDKTLVLYERPVYAKDGKTLTRTETCFLTRNIQILEALAKQGIISVPDGVDITAALTEKLEKVVINVTNSEARDNQKVIDAIMNDLSKITGQRPMICRAKKSVANFKLRVGMKIGAKVTLRRDRMYEFVDKFFNVALPRVRDFRGINPNAFDGKGNYNMGIREQLIFPEIEYEKIDRIRGMDICFVTTAKTDEEAHELLSLMGAPFHK